MNAPLSPVAGGTDDPLAGLRGYRLPDPVSWWPPAPGWWVLAFVLLAVAAALAWWWFGRRGRRSVDRLARRELDRLRRTYAGRNQDVAYLRELSALLRRYALVRWPRAEVAGLTGDDWLAFLDAQGGNGRFSDGPGRCLVEAPYRPVTDVVADDVATLVEEWMRRQQGRTA